MRLARAALAGLGYQPTIFQLEEAANSAAAAQFNAEQAGDYEGALAAQQQAAAVAAQLAQVYANPPASQAANVQDVLAALAPQPLTISAPVAVQSPSGGTTIVAPTPQAAKVACAAGYTVDASGVCTLYTDAQLLAGLNSIIWTGTGDIPAEQINRLDTQIRQAAVVTTAVTPGSVLAYILGLGGNAVAGTVVTADNGEQYQMQGGMWQLYIPPAQIPHPVASSSGTTAAPSPTVASSLASYQPSSDDLYVFGAIGVGSPYTLDAITFAQAVEAFSGSPVSGVLTKQEIQSAYQAYHSGGVQAVQQTLAAALSAATAAMEQATGAVPVTSGMGTGSILLLGTLGIGAYMLMGRHN